MTNLQPVALWLMSERRCGYYRIAGIFADLADWSQSGKKLNCENFNPRIPGMHVCDWDCTSEKWAGPGCRCYLENIKNPKTANPRKF